MVLVWALIHIGMGNKDTHGFNIDTNWIYFQVYL